MPSHDAAVNRRILLAARPQGRPTPQDFQLDTTPVPTPAPGQVLLRTRTTSRSTPTCAT